MDTETAQVPCAHGRTDSITDQITDEDDDEVLDPRVQRELDQLNLTSSEINQLENELDEARSKYRSIVSETSQRMEAIAQNRKKSIQKAREYYKLLNDAKLAQGEALKAARQFQSATGVYKAAKETEALAERSLQEKTDSATTQLTSAWQDMLNHAVAKVSEAEKEKTTCEKEHKKRAAKFAEIEGRKQLLEKKFSRSIKKAKPYFDLKMEMDVKLMQQKQNVIDLQAAIKANKVKYKAALRRLEKISEEIHQLRNEKLWAQVPRMPGVGAETDSITSGLSELALDAFDIKDETDGCSAEGESMTEASYSDGISVTIGADEPPDGESVSPGEGAEVSRNGPKDNAEHNQDSDDEVFEDAETGPETVADDTAEKDSSVNNCSVNSSLTSGSKDTAESLKDLGGPGDKALKNENNDDMVEKNTDCLETTDGKEIDHESKGAKGEETTHTSSSSTEEKIKDDFTDVNMSAVERPSLSGEEE